MASSSSSSTPPLSRIAFEAYERLYNTTQLEAYVHRHPVSTWRRGRPSSQRQERGSARCEGRRARSSSELESATEDVESSFGGWSSAGAEEVTCDSEEGIESPSGDSGEGSETPSGDNDDLSGVVGHQGWTSQEIALFMSSLARRSRLQPDLIANDMAYSKSTAQIVQLISLMEARRTRNTNGEGGQDEARSESEQGTAAMPTQRISRRIARIEPAIEMSDSWVAFEEEAAALLRHASALRESEVDPGASRALDDESADSFDEDFIAWDEQIVNALLFLRHHPKVHTGESGKRPLHFSSSKAVSLLQRQQGTGQGKSRHLSYRQFAMHHPVPCMQGDSLSHRHGLLPWRLLYRAVEQGLLVWLDMDSDGLERRLDHVSPHKGVLPSRVSPRHFCKRNNWKLAWTDAVFDDCVTMVDAEWGEIFSESQVAFDTLEQTRWKCSLRLFNTLTRIEVDWVDSLLQQQGYNSEESLDTSTNGRKRKRSCGHQQEKSKKRRTDYGAHRAIFADASDIEVEDGISSDNDKSADPGTTHIGTRSTRESHIPPRFRAVGACEDDLLDFLGEDSLESLRVLNLCRIAPHFEALCTPKDDNGLEQSISLQAITSIAHALRRHLSRLVAGSLREASRYPRLQQAVYRDAITARNVRTAAQKASNEACRELGEMRPGDTVYYGDAYPCAGLEASSMREMMELSLAGIERGQGHGIMPHQLQAQAGVRSAGVVRALDAFVLPQRESRTPHDGIDANDGEVFRGNEGLVYASDSEESATSSIFDDAAQEEAIRQRRDAARGALPERPEGLDRRQWQHSEAREDAEEHRWAQLDARDLVQSHRHEARLWARVDSSMARWHAQMTTPEHLHFTSRQNSSANLPQGATRDNDDSDEYDDYNEEQDDDDGSSEGLTDNARNACGPRQSNQSDEDDDASPLRGRDERAGASHDVEDWYLFWESEGSGESESDGDTGSEEV